MTNFYTNSSTRRSFLKMGGAFLALPFMETFAGNIKPSTSAAKKMIFLGGGFGFTKETFYPKKGGHFSKIGLTEGLAPLKRHIDDITMVTNLTNIGATNPHGGSSTYLTGKDGGVSCDQLIANHLGQDTRFGSLVLSAKETDGGQNSGHGGGLSLSYDEQGKTLPGIDSPLELYKSLFKNADDSPKALEARLKKEQSVLDIVRIEGSTIKRTLSKGDQEKLDEYFTGVRQVEKKLERQVRWANVPKPDAPFEMPEIGLTGEDEIHAMYDMIIVALQTDATRVVSYRQPVCSVLAGMGISLKAHSLSHYGFSQPRKIASEERDQKCMTLFAHFIDRLKEAKDIDGSSLYDNCIVSYGTNLRSGHELKNLPALLSGGGAQQIEHGRNLVLPKKDTPLANYWLTLMQQGGINTEQFSHSTGIIPELLNA
ncbi:MAG: DUF1552 domain-containing protein [Akkermansiaceae bacterium]